MTTTAEEPLDAVTKARLAAEILHVYTDVYRRIRRREDISTAVEAVRRQALEQVKPATPTTRAHLSSAMVRTLSKLPTDSRCLVKSLVLLSLLARRGIATTLVIGARTRPDFIAHAWIEEAGRPLLPTGGPQFERLVEL